MDITFEQAKQIATEFINKICQRHKVELVIYDKSTVTHSLGWVFTYLEKAYVDGTSHRNTLLGNAPLLVLKNGDLLPLYTAYDIEPQLKELLDTGSINGRTIDELKVK